VRKYLLPCVLTLLAVLCFVSAAFGADPTPVPQEPLIVSFLAYAIKVLGVAIGVVVTWLLSLLASYLKKKYNWNLSTSEQAWLSDQIDHGINYAEEQGRKAIKNKATSLTMNEKAEHAFSFVWSLLEAKGVQSWTQDQIKKFIESRLHVTRVA
jgi:prepilin signal peptidase PulO-like enzyme (type II secretory pathway)